MKNKIFKITLSVVYKDNVSKEEACDNLFESMRDINDKLIMLNVDSIKEVKKPNEIIQNILLEIQKQDKDNASSKKLNNGDNYIEIKKDKK